MKNLLLIGLLGLILTGCSSFTPIKHNPDDSFALNIARQAGFANRLKDAEVPKNELGDFRDGAAFNLGYAASSYLNPVGGLSSGASAGIALTSWILQPTDPAYKNRIFGWIPKSESNDPQQYLLDKIVDATLAVAKEKGFVTKLESVNLKKRKAKNVFFEYEDPNCAPIKGWPGCWLAYSVGSPKTVPAAPEFLSSPVEQWFFTKDFNNSASFIFNKNKGSQDEAEFLMQLSKHLPKNIFIYAAPEKIQSGKDKLVKFPIIFNQGESHFFVKAK